MFQILCSKRDLTQESKWIVLQNINTLMICPQVVNLFFVHWRPEICTNEFQCLQFILKSRPILCKPKKQTGLNSLYVCNLQIMFGLNFVDTLF